jgi:hypothetical protein
MAPSNAAAPVPNDARENGVPASSPNERPHLGDREHKFVIKVSLPIPT